MRRHWVAALVLLTVAVVALTMGVANAANEGRPYGGCKEAWQAPRSEGAGWCRDHGWTVRQRFLIGPRGRLHYVTLRACPSEDSGNCYYDAKRRGNGEGDSFVIKGQRDGFHCIWSPLRIRRAVTL